MVHQARADHLRIRPNPGVPAQSPRRRVQLPTAWRQVDAHRVRARNARATLVRAAPRVATKCGLRDPGHTRVQDQDSRRSKASERGRDLDGRYESADGPAARDATGRHASRRGRRRCHGRP